MALPFLRQAGQERKLGSPTFCLRSTSSHILAAALLLLVSSCDTTKRLGEGQYLLKKNRVLVSDKSADRGELESIVKQKPNKRILGIPFYLALYNLRDPDKVFRKRQLKDSVCAQRDLERVQRGKTERTCDHASRPRNGEPPVVADTSLTRRSAEQIRLYMQKEGWFRATVSDSIYHTHRKPFSEVRGRPYKQPKVEVVYTVIPGPTYHLRNITFTVDDPTIRGHVQADMAETLIKAGQRFDTDLLDAERSRVADALKELGYLFFTKDLVLYDADTTVGTHQVDVILRLERPYAKTERGLQGTREGSVYTIQDVTILTNRDPRSLNDTAEYQGTKLLYKDHLLYRPRSLLNSIFLVPNNRFRQSDGDLTYRRLTSLRVFDRVEVVYDTTGTGRPGIANVRIGLLPGKPQSMTVEVYGTNRGGFLGTTFSLGYRHRNIFRSLGFLQSQINFGVETQQNFTFNESPGQVNQAIGGNDLFNTVSIGPEVTLGFPLRTKSRSSGMRLLVNLLYNYQRRPDFIRTLARGSLGIEWKETLTKTWNVSFVDVSAIKIPSKSASFQDFLIQINDPVFTNSYTDHLIVNIPRVTFTWNTQATKTTRSVYFLRSTAELAGTAIRGIQELFQGNTPQVLDTATQRPYRTLFGVRYAEYLKVDNDFRINRVIHEGSSIAFRCAAGIGIPLVNLEVLPFETSFFGGGANGMRAWRARSLGPGSYAAPLFAFDRVGEIRLEANFEYRFKLISFLEGALFTDVGNIWDRRKDPRRPGGEFEVRDFVSELAVGTGVGARLNFDFFIVRFDLGMQTKDPALPIGERWLFQPKDNYEAALSELTGSPANYRTQLNFNLGIGYPF